MKNRFVKSLLVIAIACFAQEALAVAGRVAIWKAQVPVLVQVELPEFQGGSFENSFFLLKRLPASLVPDASGCYCYETTDSRFAYVQAWYYANKQVGELSHHLESAGFSRLRKFSITLHEIGKSGAAPYGAADFSGLAIDYGFARPAFDPSLLAHEIGHLVHFQLLGVSIPEVIRLPSSPDAEVPSEEARLMIYQMGYVEGVAQLGSILFTQDTQVGRYDWFDAAYELDSFVRFPDLIPSYESDLMSKMNSSIFSQEYPRTAALAREALNQAREGTRPELEARLRLPNPYSASAVVIQPLIHLARISGWDYVYRLHLKTLKSLKTWKGYDDWASELVKHAADEPEYKEFLGKAFIERGLIVPSGMRRFEFNRERNFASKTSR